LVSLGVAVPLPYLFLNLLLLNELLMTLQYRSRGLRGYSRYFRTPEGIVESVRELSTSEERGKSVIRELTVLRDRLEELRKLVEDYVNKVKGNPQAVTTIAEQATKRIEDRIREFGALEPGFEEGLRIWLGKVLIGKRVLLEIKKALDRLSRDFVSSTRTEDETLVKFVDALDLLLEHVVTQLLWFLEDPAKYNEDMSEFLTRYSDDAHTHVMLNVSAILLLKVLRRQVPLWLITEELSQKRRAAIEKLSEIAEELEPFTATFQLMKSQIPGEELEIAGSVKSVEELRRVLSLE